MILPALQGNTNQMAVERSNNSLTASSASSVPIAPSNAAPESVVVVVHLEKRSKHMIDLMVSGLGALGWSTPSFASGELGGTLVRYEHGVHCASESKLDFFLNKFSKEGLRISKCGRKK